MALGFQRRPTFWHLSRSFWSGSYFSGVLDSRLASGWAADWAPASTLPLHLPFLRFVGFGSVHTAQTPHLFGRPPLEDIRRVAPLRRRGERGYHLKNAAWPHQFRPRDGAKPQSPARIIGGPPRITSAPSVRFCTICLIIYVPRKNRFRRILPPPYLTSHSPLLLSLLLLLWVSARTGDADGTSRRHIPEGPNHHDGSPHMPPAGHCPPLRPPLSPPLPPPPFPPSISLLFLSFSSR